MLSDSLRHTHRRLTASRVMRRLLLRLSDERVFVPTSLSAVPQSTWFASHSCNGDLLRSIQLWSNSSAPLDIFKRLASESGNRILHPRQEFVRRTICHILAREPAG